MEARLFFCLIVLVAVKLSFVKCHSVAQGCGLEQLYQKPGLSEHWVTIDGSKRRFVLYLPTYYHLLVPSQLWILAPGSNNKPEKQIEMSEMVLYAEQQQFPFVAIEGDSDLLNVMKNSQPDPNRVDDIAYIQAVLGDMSQKLCIDQARIYCAGYSRGARFCSRLASELSSTIAAIAPISGIRFPKPNNATRPIPIMAFHGTGDPVNPYMGYGNAEYWYDSVPDAIDQWAEFNGCKQLETQQLSPGVISEKHTDCIGGADVVLIKVINGGHTWPGSRFNFKGLGMTTHEINASVVMGAFFREHNLAMKDKDILRWAVRSIVNI